MSAEDYRPYAFLAALDGDRAEDREIIRETRGEEVRITGHMVLGSKITTIYAFSGNGKTSLINAGLVPFFLDLGYSVLKTRPRPPYALSNPVQAFKEGCIRENWVPGAAVSDAGLVTDARQQLEALSLEMLPGVRRLVQLVEARLTRLSASPESRSADLSTHLRRIIDSPLPEFLASAQRFLGSNTPMVVICDQFEEIFVHYYNTPAFDAFVQALQETCDRQDVRVHFLFSMREDWVGSMIAFRRAIPDILNCSFRLDPIRRSKAAPALALPAARAGYVLDLETAKVILADLCRFYDEQQQKGLLAVRLTRSPADDPFIELPALQAVGDRLWDTRDLTEKYQPFTVEHYRAMVPPEEVQESGSPASAVLEHYLADTMRGIDDGRGLPDPVLDEIRLDVLYLLTDKSAHRRGLGEKELLAEMRRIRPSGLKLREMDLDILRKAIVPLRHRWLIREEFAADKEVRYELAHDFVVRSVVRAWGELDRRRVRELAILSRKRDEVERKVTDLSRMERTGLLGITAVAPLVVAALAWVMYMALAQKPAPWSLGYTVLWYLAAPSLVLLSVGVVSRSWAAAVIAALALLFCIGLGSFQSISPVDFPPADFGPILIDTYASRLYERYDSMSVSGAPSMLSSNESRVFVVANGLTAISTGGNCPLTAGDVLQMNGAPPRYTYADVVVLASKGRDCRKGSVVSVALNDLQEMQNQMRATIDQGLGDLQSKQGQGRLPALPTGGAAPPPDVVLPSNSPAGAAAPPDDALSYLRFGLRTLGADIEGGLPVGLAVSEVSNRIVRDVPLLRYSDVGPDLFAFGNAYDSYIALRRRRIGYRVAYLDEAVAPVAFGLGFFLMVSYAAILAAFARRWPWSDAVQRKMLLLWGESIDIVLALAFGFLCLGAVARTPLRNIEIVPHNLWLATFVASVWALYTVGSTTMVRIQRRPIGYVVAGVTDARLPRTLGRTLLRQAVFGIWSALNLPWLLPALLLRLLWRPANPQPFYDRWTASPELLPVEADRSPTKRMAAASQ